MPNFSRKINPDVNSVHAEAPWSLRSVATSVLAPEIVTVLIMLSVGFASFGLGRLSASGMTPQPVQIVHPPATQAAAVATTAGTLDITVDEQLLPIIPESGKFVASKNGTKYHFPWCSGAKRISEKNKVWFSSADHARRAGYEPAANCRGLE